MVENNMKTVHRVVVLPHKEQKFNLPLGAKFLHMDQQIGVPCAWFLVDKSKPPTLRTFILVETGQPIEHEHIDYCGTCLVSKMLPQLFPGAVPSMLDCATEQEFHLFEVLYAPNKTPTTPSAN